MAGRKKADNGPKRVLRRRGVKPEDFEGLTDAVLGQAAALWKKWPMVA